MELRLNNIKENPAAFLRKAGYVFQYNKGEEMSFIRNFSSSGFPRFHIYAKVKDADLIINIHLDRKKETYGEGKRHHGEYGGESETVVKEVERIKKIVAENSSNSVSSRFFDPL